MSGLTRAAAAAAVAIALAGCSLPTTTLQTQQSPVSKKHGLIVVHGLGWTASGLTGTIPPPNSCHYRHVPGSADVLPDPKCTPGAVTDAVTQANISQTICRPGGYTSSVRPPYSLTEPAKRAIMDAYGLQGRPMSDYELDHLVDLADGGSPGSVLNLWPEPEHDQEAYARTSYVHNDKDYLEDAGRDAVCGGRRGLVELQRAFAANWTSVARLLGVGR